MKNIILGIKICSSLLLYWGIIAIIFLLSAFCFSFIVNLFLSDRLEIDRLKNSSMAFSLFLVYVFLYLEVKNKSKVLKHILRVFKLNCKVECKYKSNSPPSDKELL